jgi:tRNA(Ile)-lysidine synthetase-like protein
MIYNIIKYVYNYIFSINSDEINYKKYKDILEYLPNNSTIPLTDEDNPLFKSIKKFCIKENKNKFAVSLSGGVDSMVLIYIILKLGYEVIAIHINYNNREETIQEQKLLEEWCQFNNIKIYIKSIEHQKRNNTKRSTYEFETKNIRFDYYKEVLAEENLDSTILIAHHKDDIVENIFTNVCRGRYLLDLSVIKERSILNDVTIVRPMLDHYKSAVYEYAHDNQIPYFKDTTPIWSIRGKYRKNMYPLLEDAFSTNIKNNLLGLSRQSYEWNDLVMAEIIQPFLDTVNMYDNYCTFNVENYANKPMCFWNMILMKIFYSYGKKCPSRSGIQTFMNSIKILTDAGRMTRASISNNCTCMIRNYNIKIVFDKK